MSIDNINIGVLAYLGDAVYELEVRKSLIDMGINKSSLLQKQALNYVSAKAQCEILKKLMEEGFFDEKDVLFIKHARNYKPNSKAKHADVLTYKYATALEAYFGKLYLENNVDKIKIIMKKILGD